MADLVLGETVSDEKPREFMDRAYVNEKKIRELLTNYKKISGKTLRQMEKECGFSNAYLSQIMSRGAGFSFDGGMRLLNYAMDGLEKELKLRAILKENGYGPKQKEKRMMLSEEKTKELEELCKPLVKFLNENLNPHAKIIVTPSGAELVKAVIGIPIKEFIKD